MTEISSREIVGISRLKILTHLLWIIPLYLTTLYSYLLFHVAAELFSIIVAFGLFTVTLNSRSFSRNPYLRFIGIAYLFIGFLDLLHTLAYKGMNIFPEDIFYANQLWIAARAMESLSLLFAFIILKKNWNPSFSLIMSFYGLITAAVTASVFWLKVFPLCFIGGQGQTPFKIFSEYFIMLIYALAIYFLYDNRSHFDSRIYRFLLWSLIASILSELAFTFYISNYGFSNLVGHYLKIVSFMLIYQSVVKTGIRDPLALIFKELNDEIAQRKEAEAAKTELISNLQKALAEIKTLQGILPICMHCRKVRDDQGYWTRLEEYLSNYSDVEVSHGLCPDCFRKHYPEVPFPDTLDPVTGKSKI